MAHRAEALGRVDQIGLQPDDPARRDGGLHQHAVRMVLHVGNVGLARGKGLEDVAEILGRDVDVKGFHRLEQGTVVSALENHFWTRDKQLEAFAAHLLDEDGNLHFAPGLDLELPGNFGLGDLQRNIGPGLAGQPVFDLAGGEQLALASGQRRVVHANAHADRRRIDLDKGQRSAFLVVDQSLADEDVLETGQTDDVAFGSRLDLHFIEALVAENSGHVGPLFTPVGMEADDGLSDLDRAADDPPVSNTAEVITVVEVRHEHLEIVGVGLFRRGNMPGNGFVQGDESVARINQFAFGEAGFGTGVNVREIKLLVGRVQFEEKLEDHVEDLVGTGVFAVDLVDHHHRLEAVLHRFAEDEFGLGLRSLVSVNHKQHAIDHLHDAFHFPAEVGVPRGVDDVDVVFVPLERGILRADCDPLFFLEIHRVHDPLLELLVGLKGSRLTEQLVNQGGLAVVDVGDDSDVANIFHTDT